MATTGMFLTLIVFFFCAQYLVEKEKLPGWLMNMSTGKQLLTAIGLLFLSVVVGVVIQVILLPIVMTILLASVVSARFRKGFLPIEKDEK